MSIATALTRPGAGHPGAAADGAAPILIVDDNPAKRLALRAVLAPLGYVIVEADSGDAALRCVMGNDFAVILLDVRMPIMDGFETAALIRLRAESELTPIIFVTAQTSDGLVVDRYAAGAVDFITAPVAPEELRAKVSVLANLFLQARANAAKARELQGTADQLRLLTDTAPIGIFQTDADDRYTYTNARWAEITGVPGTDAVGAEWHIIIDAAQQAAIAADFHDNYVVGAEFSSRLRIVAPDGSLRIVMMTSRPLFDDERRPRGRVGTLADITAEVAAAEAMTEARDLATEASRLKSDFLANMSHEIRTPMSGVIGWTELLMETDLDVHQRGFVQTLSRSGEALMNVINGILDFSKIEKGHLDVEDIEFDLHTVVDEAVDLLAQSAQTKGLALMAAIEDSVPQVVRGDANRLRQVLTNLIGNAIKFTQTGEITIRVTADQVAGSDAVVRFEVADTGVGIAADKLAMIFEPFTQADTSITRKHGGTGLGLAISSRLTQLMGGEVGVTSVVGAGSTFWFTIGFRPGADQASPGPLAHDAALVGIRALVVDDNATHRSILFDYLRRWGMQVETAGSAVAALEALEAASTRGEPVAVALIDRSMHLPGGGSLAMALAADPRQPSALVVMDQQGDLDDTPGTAGLVSLSKPIHQQTLRARLQEALGLRSMTDGVGDHAG